MSEEIKTEENASDETRRAFLAKYGRIAAVTPAAMTLMLSTSLEASGVSRSGGKPGNPKKRRKRRKKRRVRRRLIRLLKRYLGL